MLPALVLAPDSTLRIVWRAVRACVSRDPLRRRAGAVAMANDTWSGLCSSVWSPNPDTRACRQATAHGVTFFNNHNATAVDERAPFGGFNQSGIGRRARARRALLEFTETHVMSVPDASTRGALTTPRPSVNRLVAGMSRWKRPS